MAGLPVLMPFKTKSCDSNPSRTVHGANTKEPRGLRMQASKAEHEQYFYLRMLQQHFRPGVSWLDAGCGHSLIPDWLVGAAGIERKFLIEARQIVGADVDSQSLAAPSSIQRTACRLEALSFKAESFDLITCNMVVEHLTVPSTVFKEFFRVLRPGGVVLILTPNIYHWANIVSMSTPLWFHRWVLKTFFSRAPEDVFPTFYRCNTERTIQRLLRSAGFLKVLVHMVPGRQRLMGFGPLFYPEYLFYRASLNHPQLREILCAIAEKT
jgi:ubiquinone/menaquinone biosynthesis C-methylase UbiE